MITEPSKPEELTVHDNMITKTTIILSWKEPIPTDVSIVGYELEYRENDKDFKKVANELVHSEDLPYEVTGLNAYTRYGFRVAAVNSAGTGLFTDVVTQFTSKCCKSFLLYMYIFMYIVAHVAICT